MMTGTVFEDSREIRDGHQLAVRVAKYTTQAGGFNPKYRLKASHIGPIGALVQRLREEWVGEDREDAIYEAIDALENDGPLRSSIRNQIDTWDQAAPEA